MEKKNNKCSILIGLFFVLVGMIIIGLNMFYINTYEPVDGILEVSKYRRNNGKKSVNVYVTYEYNGVTYNRVHLSSHNLFTMKDGMKTKVYVNKEKPSNPQVPDFWLGILCVILGGGGAFLSKKKRK